MMDISNKMISIIVPIYNVAPYLERCVNSLIAQTYKEIEIILVDDGSTDDGGDICDELAKNDERILVVHKENGGVTSARKKGLSVSGGAYIGVVDPDDWVEPDMFESLIKSMLDSDADLVCDGMKREKDGCVYAEWFAGDYPSGIYKGQKLIELKKSMINGGKFHISGSMCNKLFKRDRLVDCLMKLDERMRGIGDDLACVFPYILNSNGVTIVNNAFYHGCDRAGSATFCHYDTWYEQSNLLYVCLKQAVLESDLKDTLMPWLNEYWKKEIIIGMGHYFPDSQTFRFPNRICKTDGKTRIILYGAGTVGKNYYTQFTRDKSIVVKCWVDKKYDDICTEGYNVRAVEEISKTDFDYVVIGVYDKATAEEIISSLWEEYGICEDKIIWERPISFLEYCIREQVI